MLGGAISLVAGIVIGVVILNLARSRGAAADANPGLPAWLTLGLGLVALGSFALATWLSGTSGEPAVLWWLSMLCALAAVVAGVGLVIRRDRRWPVWLGLAAGLIPAVLWLAFTVGEIMYSG
ncbi:MAG TPA: hypothetical protein VIU39_14930 [Anaerolineales bacterium]